MPARRFRDAGSGADRARGGRGRVIALRQEDTGSKNIVKHPKKRLSFPQMCRWKNIVVNPGKSPTYGLPQL